MWTKNREGIEAFIGVCDTGGAIRKYEYYLELRDDGDEWWSVGLPVWRQNTNVQKYVVEVLTKCLTIGDCDFYASDNKIILNLHIHHCDPD